MKTGRADKLDACLMRFSLLWGGMAILALWMIVSSLFLHRSMPEISLGLVQELNLTSLSLIPSGQVLRNPAIRHPGVDTRMVPSLPPLRLESASLLLHVE